MLSYKTVYAYTIQIIVFYLLMNLVARVFSVIGIIFPPDIDEGSFPELEHCIKGSACGLFLSFPK
jgi:hypothetical protein